MNQSQLHCLPPDRKKTLSSLAVLPARREANTLQRVSEPNYTHALHAHACQIAASKRQILVQHVLAKRGQVIYCAKIKNAYTVPDGGPDCWTLETLWPEKTRITVPVKNVIACDSEFCSCAHPVEVAMGGSVAGLGGLDPVSEVTCL